MLKSFPYDGNARVTIPFPVLKAAQLSDPAYGLVQSGRSGWQTGGVMDRTIQGLPFGLIQESQARELRG